MGIFIVIYPKPYSIYLRGTIGLGGSGVFGFVVRALKFRGLGLGVAWTLRLYVPEPHMGVSQH